MDITASHLRRGVEVDSAGHDGTRYTLWWNPKTKYYEITDYANTKNVHYRYRRLSDIVRTLNSLTGWDDKAVEDVKE